MKARRGVEPGDELLAGVGRDVFLGEINVRFDVGQRLEHFVAQLVDALGELAGELFVGGAQGQFGAGVDQIGDGFGLRQVNAPVEKGAAGELAGLGQARAVREHGVQDHFRGQNPAVAGDLDHILAREGARGAHDGEQGLIHVCPSRTTWPKWMVCVAAADGLAGSFAGGAKERSATASACGAREADDGQPAFAERRGNRSDGVVQHNVPGVKPAGSPLKNTATRLPQ